MRHPARLAGASLLRLQSDTRLAELAVAGHVAAFDAIVDRYRTPLLRYCAGIVGPSRAEDAVQQALINAHDALRRTDEVRHLRSWLYRIAHNAALNVLRAVRDDVSLDDGASASLALGASSGPAEAFETSERFRATVAALRELPERQRAALVLRELEGRSHEEIAEALGVTKGSARQHLMRARVAMRGAVTAITPYPIVVRLADALASPGGASWTDAAVGAGTGATLAKLTAGVAATGALVGGAVGTHEVVRHHRGTPAASAETRGAAPARTTPAAAGVVRHAAAIVLPPRAAPVAGAAPSSDRHRHPTAARRPHRRPPEHAAPTVTPAPPTLPSTPPAASPGTPGTGDDDSTTSRHGSQQESSNNGPSSSSGKGSSGHGSGDSGSGGSSGKGKGDSTPATTVPLATAPVATPTSGSGSSGSSTSGSGSSGTSGSGSGPSGSDTSGSGSSGSSGSGSSGSGSSGSDDSGSGSSGGDGTTTVADDG